VILDNVGIEQLVVGGPTADGLFVVLRNGNIPDASVPLTEILNEIYPFKFLLKTVAIRCVY
jgi:hypothetical protein